MPEYTLTMTSAQARTMLKAVELFMRLKINQPEEISRAIMDGEFYDRIGCDEFCKRRDIADMHLRKGFMAIFPLWSEVKKDTEWYRLYNLYQSVRYAIHEAEHPESDGVDSRLPMQFTDEPIPKCEWRK